MTIAKWPKANDWAFAEGFEVWLTGSGVKGTRYG